MRDLTHRNRGEFSLSCLTTHSKWDYYSITLQIQDDNDLHITDERLIGPYQNVPLYKVVSPQESGGDIRVAYNNFARGGKKPQVVCIDQMAVLVQLQSSARFGGGQRTAQRVIPEPPTRRRARSFNPAHSRRRSSPDRYDAYSPLGPDLRVGQWLITALTETAAQKPTFRWRRCLVLADGFYVWVRRRDARQPWLVFRRDGGLVVFAALWERWRVPDRARLSGSLAERRPGDAVEKFTIVSLTKFNYASQSVAEASPSPSVHRLFPLFRASNAFQGAHLGA